VGRKFLIAAGGLLAVFGILIGAIWLATGPGNGPARPPPPPAAAAPEAAVPIAPGAAIDLAKAPLGGIPAPPPVIVKDEPPPPPPHGSWEAVPILVSRRGPVQLNLEEVRPRLTECFRADVASSGGTVLFVKDAAPLSGEWTTTLLLQIEVSQDRAFVVEAPLESRGKASDGTIACAQAALRGQTAPAGGLPSGRHRLRFVLTP
jgi:hypothetical protein